MPVARPSPYAVVARNIDPAAANKIHDDEVARRFGFSAALVPGVELFAYLTPARSGLGERLPGRRLHRRELPAAGPRR